MAETRNYSMLLPVQPPDGSLEWVRKRGALNAEFLIYKAEWYTDPLTEMKEKGVRAICSCCGESAIYDYVPAGGCGGNYAPAPFGFVNPLYKETVISGSSTQCPFCGAEVTVKHVGNIPNGVMQEAWALQVSRFEDRAVLLGWLFRRQIDKNGKSEFFAVPYEAYVVEEKKIVRLVAYQKFIHTVCLLGHWEQRKTYRDTWGYAPAVLPFDENVLLGTTAENSKLMQYLKGAEKDTALPVTYVKLWQKHKNAENLVVQGAAYLLHDMMKRAISGYHYSGVTPSTEISGVDWKAVRPAQMLGLNKEEFRICINQRWSATELECYKELRALEKIQPEEIAALRRYNLHNVCRLARKEKDGVSALRCLRYLDRQNDANEKTAVKVDIGYLLDYWDMAQKLGRDLRDQSLRLPKNLRNAHDRDNALLQEISAKKRAEELEKQIASRRPAFISRAKELTAYGWEFGGLLIRPAETEEELIREGKYLSHCVASYASRVASGNTAIFFIRRKETPEIPFFTLELDENQLTVRQNRGKKNCARTEAVQEFETRWLAELRRRKAAGLLEKKKNSTRKKKESAA